LGPDSLEGKKFLKKKSWTDVTISPYAQGIKNPEKYSAKVFDKVAKEARGKKGCVYGIYDRRCSRTFFIEKSK